MQNLPLDFAMLKDVAGRDSNMETDQRVKRGERTKWLALGDRESGLLGIGRSLPVFLTPTYSNSPPWRKSPRSRSFYETTDPTWSWRTYIKGGEVAHDWHKVEFDGW